MGSKGLSKIVASAMLASSLAGVGIIAPSVLLGNTTVYAEDVTQATPPAKVNINVHKLMYDKGTSLDVEKDGIINDGYSKAESDYPSGVTAFDKATYGDVQFTLVDITKLATPTKDSTLTNDQIDAIVKDVEDNGENSQYVKGGTKIGTSSVDGEGNVSWANQPAYVNGQRSVYVVYESKSAQGLVQQKAKPSVIVAPMTTNDGKGFLKDINMYPKNITQKLQFVLTKLGDDGKTGVNAKALAGAKFDLYKGELGKGTKIGTLTAGDDGKLTATDLTLGKYYFVEIPSDKVASTTENPVADGHYLLGADARNDANNKLGFEVTADGVNPDDLKGTYINYLPPTAKKEVTNGVGSPDKSFSIGQSVHYKGTVHVPNDVSGGTDGIDKNGDKTVTQPYSVLNWKDTAGKGISYVSSKADIKVTAESKALVKDTDYKIVEAENGFTVDFIVNDGKVSDTVAGLKGKDIIIDYNMIVNEDAVVADQLNNSFDLSYNNNPYDESGQETKHITGKVPVYTWGAKFIKEDSGLLGTGIDKTPLEGAVFVVKNKDGKFYAGTVDGDKDGVPEVTWVDEESKAKEITSDKDGYFQISGLFEGTYTLQEQKAPDGYQKMTENITFEVNKESFKDENRVVVLNDQKGVMPRTGSQRIMLVSVLGAGIAGVAFTLYAVKRKAEQKA